MIAYILTANHIDLCTHAAVTIGVYSSDEKAKQAGNEYADRMESLAKEQQAPCPMDDTAKYKAWQAQNVKIYQAKIFDSFSVKEFEVDA